MLCRIHKQLKNPAYASITTYQIYEAYDPNLILIKNLSSAEVLDKNRLLLGTDDGLYLLDISKATIQNNVIRPIFSDFEIFEPLLKYIFTELIFLNRFIRTRFYK